jgi:hypothetical protein
MFIAVETMKTKKRDKLQFNDKASRRDPISSANCSEFSVSHVQCASILSRRPSLQQNPTILFVDLLYSILKKQETKRSVY